jgi:hypothetical protein
MPVIAMVMRWGRMVRSATYAGNEVGGVEMLQGLVEFIDG